MRWRSFSCSPALCGVSAPADYMNFSSVNFKQYHTLLQSTNTNITELIPPTEAMEGIYLQYLVIQIQIKRERMTSSPFPLLKLEDTQRNANSEYGISQPVQRNLANGNTQFVIDVARQMKISYSIPTIALQIVARFFHVRCYIHYDRFLIIIACLILAFKLRYLEFRFKDVVYAFHQVMCFRNQTSEIYNETILKRLKEEINIAENQVLRTLEYQIDVTTPHDYLAQIILLSFPGQTKTQTTEKVKLTTRIIILDSNRAQTSLYFSPLTICIGALMIACRYLNVKPYALVGNTKASTEVSEKTEQQLYGEWLECICNNQKQKVKQQDVLECIKHMNKIVKIIGQS